MAQAVLPEALSVKVWVSRVYESSPEKGSMDGPLIMPALPLADETSLTPEAHDCLESRTPHELAHLVALIPAGQGLRVSGPPWRCPQRKIPAR